LLTTTLNTIRLNTTLPIGKHTQDELI
jgi:hypothetical protein